jgi:hypothetical protein
MITKVNRCDSAWVPVPVMLSKDYKLLQSLRQQKDMILKNNIFEFDKLFNANTENFGSPPSKESY